MATVDDPPPLLTIDQLAQRLGTSARHVRRLVAERRVPYIKVGKFVRFDPDDIAGWLDQARRPLHDRAPSVAGRATHPRR